MRYRLDIAYKGTSYHGWQIQPNAVTVQEILNDKLSLILREKIKTTGSGRTDTGVHASQQTVHFDCINEISFDLKHKLNAILPADIAINNTQQVTEEFHARFSAKSRAYHYYITSKKSPFLIDSSYLFSHKLDIESMNQACDILKKHTNFEAFSKVKTAVNNFECTIFEAKWNIERNQIIFYIKANRFLRNMVRAIVGTMLEVGTNQISLEKFEQVIESKSRKKAGFSVPAHGLYLSEVNYEENTFCNN